MAHNKAELLQQPAREACVSALYLCSSCCIITAFPVCPTFSFQCVQLPDVGQHCSRITRGATLESIVARAWPSATGAGTSGSVRAGRRTPSIADGGSFLGHTLHTSNVFGELARTRLVVVVRPSALAGPSHRCGAVLDYNDHATRIAMCFGGGLWWTPSTTFWSLSPTHTCTPGQPRAQRSS